jgi:hypothetical protein
MLDPVETGFDRRQIVAIAACLLEDMVVTSFSPSTSRSSVMNSSPVSSHGRDYPPTSCNPYHKA